MINGKKDGTQNPKVNSGSLDGVGGRGQNVLKLAKWRTSNTLNLDFHSNIKHRKPTNQHTLTTNLAEELQTPHIAAQLTDCSRSMENISPPNSSWWPVT